MLLRVAALTVAITSLASPGPADDKKPKRPTVELRASPRVAVVPGNVIFTAEIKGGEDEALRCVTLSWDWGDGNTSEQDEVDCDPADGSPVSRRFTQDREFRQQGRPTVTVTVRKAGSIVAKDSVGLILQEKRDTDLKMRHIQ